MPFAGIVVEEFAGAVTRSISAGERPVTADEGIAFPLGRMDTFTTHDPDAGPAPGLT